MSDSPKFTMSISLNALRHLGIGLYSNVPAVLSELVANAWDADSSVVDIHVRIDDGVIEVIDNGCGMTEEDLNNRFLRVGYQRREEGTKTVNGRPVMGRKGIGKLSVFSIARIVEVHTAKAGSAHAFRMDRKEIEARIGGKDTDVYNPTTITPKIDPNQHGTRLVLREINKRLTQTVPYLRRRLAWRFSIIGAERGFEVRVNSTPISPADRGIQNKLEFLWYFGDRGESMAESAGHLHSKERIDGSVKVSSSASVTKTYQVSGWIGTVDKPEALDEINNAIVLMARGKLVHEDLLPKFSEAGVYADYILGEINADFIDTDEDDIITSGRQSVQEDAPRFKGVVEFVRNTLKTIKNEWTDLRRERGAQRALNYPTVKEWYERHGPDKRKIAKRLFGKIESLRLPDKNAKKELYKASMLAFEKLALKDTLSRLDPIQTADGFEAIIQLMSGVDEIEAVHYHEVAKGRLAVISKLEELLPSTKEAVIQGYIFDHLWLLHPSWERAASNKRIEETVGKEFDAVNAGLTDEERRGRIDIRYRTAAGKHIIIELKKYDRRVSANDLMVQLRRYKSALQKCLHNRFPSIPHHIEAISILGSAPTPVDEPKQNENILASIGARYITYDQLIAEALDSYGDYLRRQAKVSELADIIERLDLDFE